MARGRTPNSNVRANISQILSTKPHYGYELYKTYVKVFSKTSLRNIYYHLNKGVELGIFKIKEIKQNKAEYSWGESCDRIIYELKEK